MIATDAKTCPKCGHLINQKQGKSLGLPLRVLWVLICVGAWFLLTKMNVGDATLLFFVFGVLAAAGVFGVSTDRST